MIKAGGEAAARLLLRVFRAVWARLPEHLDPASPPPCCIPTQWRALDLIHIFKAKERFLPGNFRGISLMPAPCKVYTHLILNRARPLLEPSLSPTQFGFRAGRGTSEAIFTMRRLQELARRDRQPVFAAHVDLSRAFDTVSRPALSAVLRARGLDPTLISLIQDLYADNRVSVRVGSASAPPVCPTIGVRQGCPLSPLLFNVFIDLAARQLEAAGFAGVTAEVRLSGCRYKRPAAAAARRPTPTHLRRLLYLLYADDMVVLARSAAELSRLLSNLHSIFSGLGLQINFSKTKYQQLGHPSFNTDALAPSSLQLDAGTVSRAWQFAYLGSILASLQPDTPCTGCGDTAPVHETHGAMIICDTCQRGFHLRCVPAPALDAVPPGHWTCHCCPPPAANFKPEPPCVAHPLDAEMAKRLASAAAANGSLSKIWAVPHGPDADITLNIKIQFYNAFVISALLYGCCAWTLSPLHLQRLEAFHNSCLRRIKGLPPRPDATSTAALHAAGADQGGRTHPIGAWITQLRNRFIGHLARREGDYVPTCMLFAFGLQGAPAPGRPHTDYSDMIQESLAAALAQHPDDRLRAEMCDDTDFWIRMAGMRGWWRHEMVLSARPS
jgi:hypothetical protein